MESQSADQNWTHLIKVNCIIFIQFLTLILDVQFWLVLYSAKDLDVQFRFHLVVGFFSWKQYTYAMKDGTAINFGVKELFYSSLISSMFWHCVCWIWAWKRSGWDHLSRWIALESYHLQLILQPLLTPFVTCHIGTSALKGDRSS